MILGQIFVPVSFAYASCYVDAYGDYICDGGTYSGGSGASGAGSGTQGATSYNGTLGGLISIITTILTDPNTGETTTTTTTTTGTSTGSGSYTPGGGSVTPSGPAGDAQCSTANGGAVSGDTYATALKLLKLREGSRNVVYRDSLGKPTVGVGHLVTASDGLSVGDRISDAQVDAYLQQDAQKAYAAAQKQASQMGLSNNQCLVVILTSVNFQLGTGWTSKFSQTWAKILAKDYCGAVANIQASLWMKQTPVRAREFQDALRGLDPNDNC